MKPITLALLTTAAMVFTATPALAQSTTPTPTPQISGSTLDGIFDCADDSGQATIPAASADPNYWSFTPTNGDPTSGSTGGTTNGGSTATPGSTDVGDGGDPIFTLPPDFGTGGMTLPDIPIPAPTGASSSYVTKPNTGAVRKWQATVDGKLVTYFAGTYTAGYKPQGNLATVKSYSPPTSGIIKTIGGQKIQVKDSTTVVTGLDQHIINIIDEMHLTAAALSLPKPVITAGHDTAGHSPGSYHYTGDAIDIRANNISLSQAKAWVMTMKQAFGPGYNVFVEDYGGDNTHIHIQWDGKTS